MLSNKSTFVCYYLLFLFLWCACVYVCVCVLAHPLKYHIDSNQIPDNVSSQQISEGCLSGAVTPASQLFSCASTMATEVNDSRGGIGGCQE